MINLDKPVWVVIFNLSGLMHITIRNGTVGFVEYDDPLLVNMKRARVIQKDLYRMTPMDVSPGEKFINEELAQWQTETKQQKNSR